MSDSTSPRSKIDEHVANLVYHCRMTASAYNDEEQQQFFEALSIELDNLRTGLKQRENLQTP